jgi:hypothetical protein
MDLLVVPRSVKVFNVNVVIKSLEVLRILNAEFECFDIRELSILSLNKV